MSFPTNPTNGQIYRDKRWNSTKGVWEYALDSTGSNSTIVVRNSSGQIAATAFDGNASTATNVPWTGVTGRPTAVSSFTNDSGYLVSSGTIANATNLSTNRANWSTNGTITAVVGQLAWKNYSNNHTIFDASASTSPDGVAINNVNSQVVWTGSYPTLMGWNGGQTYGVRVDSARYADNGIYDAGSNYVRFIDGSAMQWGSIPQSDGPGIYGWSSWGSEGGWYSSTKVITFPIAFTDFKTYSVSAGGDVSASLGEIVKAWSIGSSTFYLSVQTTSSAPSGAVWNGLSWHAIGKWR